MPDGDCAAGVFQRVVVQSIQSLMAQIDTEFTTSQLVQHITKFIRQIFHQRQIPLSTCEKSAREQQRSRNGRG